MNWHLLGILGGVWFASVTGAYLYGRDDGSNACDARYAEAQAKQTEKVRKNDQKRDREKPVAADRDQLLKWLFQYGSE